MSPRRKRQHIEQEKIEYELDGSESISHGLQIQEKQREIWDAFREEHFEAIEQLPLSLHRQLSLMRQLDEQANGHAALLLPTLKRYIQLRKSLDPRQPIHPKDGGVMDEDNSAQDCLVSACADVDLTPGYSLIGSLSLDKGVTFQEAAPTAAGNSPFRSREVLSQAICLSDDLLQTCHEKVNLAQAAHDSIERHIRLLDQAIQEQQAAISAGQQADGNLLPILLPDLAVPRWSRTTRVTLSPVSDEGFTSLQSPDHDSPSIVDRGENANSGVKTRPKRKRRPDAKEAQIDTKLMITIPAQLDAVADPNEEVYCFCNRGSFGEMIACDGPNCKREWFHLGCVGLTESPKGKWFCDECRAARKTRGNRI